MRSFLIWQPRPLFVYFCSFPAQILQKKTVGFSGIQTRIIGIEGKHADHLTTTAQRFQKVSTVRAATKSTNALAYSLNHRWGEGNHILSTSELLTIIQRQRVLFETAQERKLFKYPFRILFSNIPNVLICGTRIDRKTDSPKKIIHLKIQNIHTYPLCKTTHHLIIST